MGMEQPDKPAAQDDMARGLPMVSAWDPEALAKERQELADLAGKPFGQRMRGYVSKVGPGWLQSAMTLGGGSAAASLFAGAFLGYGLLWLQPLSMIMGIIMLSAIAYQTLTTNVRPFDALRLHVHPALGWTWALASFTATIIWSFPQYSLSGQMAQDVIKAVSGGGIVVPTWLIGIAVLIGCTWITWNYGSGARGIKIYERVIKVMVWMIVLCFAAVVIKQSIQGSVPWGRVARGFIPFTMPSEDKPLEAIDQGFALKYIEEDNGLKELLLGRKYATTEQFAKAEKGIKLTELGAVQDAFDRRGDKAAMLAKLLVAAEAVTQAQADEVLAIQNQAIQRAKECRSLAQESLKTDSPKTISSIMKEKGYVSAEHAKVIIKALKGEGASIIMAGFGAAVGINMTLLFGYTLLARGWGREHRGLCQFDLFTGMLIPYSLAVSLMIIATASTVYPSVTKLNPVQAAQVLQPAVGLFFGRILFGLGILGMVLSSITLLMLVNAFTLCEFLRWEPTGWRYKVASMTPAVGVLGTLFWKEMNMYIGVPTSAIAGLFLPIAYIGFFILNNKKSYLGEATPRGLVAWVWNTAMLLAIAASLSSGSYYIYNKYGDKIASLFGA